MSNPVIGKYREPGVTEPFLVLEGRWFTHPNCKVSIYNIGGCALEVSPPFGADRMWLDPSSFPKNTWVDIEDEAGQLLPLSVFVNAYGAGLYAVWKPVGGPPPSPPAADWS